MKVTNTQIHNVCSAAMTALQNQAAELACLSSDLNQELHVLGQGSVAITDLTLAVGARARKLELEMILYRVESAYRMVSEAINDLSVPVNVYEQDNPAE